MSILSKHSVPMCYITKAVFSGCCLQQDSIEALESPLWSTSELEAKTLAGQHPTMANSIGSTLSHPGLLITQTRNTKPKCAQSQTSDPRCHSVKCIQLRHCIGCRPAVSLTCDTALAFCHRSIFQRDLQGEYEPSSFLRWSSWRQGFASKRWEINHALLGPRLCLDDPGVPKGWLIRAFLVLLLTISQPTGQDFCSDALLWNFFSLYHFLGCLSGVTFKSLAVGTSVLKFNNDGISRMESYSPSFLGLIPSLHLPLLTPRVLLPIDERALALHLWPHLISDL